MNEDVLTTKNGGWDFPKRQPAMQTLNSRVFRGKPPGPPSRSNWKTPLGGWRYWTVPVDSFRTPAFVFHPMGLVVYLLRTVTWMVLMFMAWKCREIDRRHGWLMMVAGSEIRHSLTSWGKGSWNPMIYRVLAAALSQVVVWDFVHQQYDIELWHTNRNHRPIHVNIHICFGGC